jgi:hypothetical protein
MRVYEDELTLTDYAARVSDFKPGDYVIVECMSCGHVGLIHSAALPSLGFGVNDRIGYLAVAFYRECDERGEAVVSIRWRGGTR